MRLPSQAAPLALISILSVALAACGHNPFSASPLRPAPTRPVSGGALPPPPVAPSTQTAVTTPEQTTTPEPEAPQTEPVPQVAAFGPAKVDEMSGGWTVTDGSGSCSLFMSTTAWTGGYRAVTRGCPSEALKTVNAWNVVDGKIALKDANGTEIARLTRTGETRYEGGFSAGGRVSFSR
ncbi:MAG: protease inhibitor Inh/omp19 family protein [Rhodobiaceae bacterium]|nr:protease inhibitor Inh/omp19 family protein [Rhodobiaceae bacterium]